MKDYVVAGFVAVLAFFPARAAHASVTYPAEVEKRLGIAALPAPAPYCTLCHRDDVGGVGTAITPLGRALSKAGALPNNIPSLDSALSALETAKADSDGDGVSDVDELRADTSPNQGTGPVAEDPLADVPLPRTGCALSHPGGGAGATLAAIMCAGLLLLAGRARRRSP